MPQIDVDAQWRPLWDPECQATHMVFPAGRAAGKSTNVSQRLIFDAMQEKMTILFALQYKAPISESMHPTIESQIHAMGYSDWFDIGQARITCLTTGTVMIFKGLERNPESALKGIHNLKRVHIDEAQLINKKSMDTLIDTAVRVPGCQMFWTLNPTNEDDPVYKEFVTEKKWGCKVYWTSYKQNTFLTSAEAWARIQELKRTDYDRYLYIYGGELDTKGDTIVFPKLTLLSEHDAVPEIPAHAQQVVAADWGHASDPSVAALLTYWDNRLYLSKEQVVINPGNEDIIAMMDAIPEARKSPLIVDINLAIVNNLKANGYPHVETAIKNESRKQRLNEIWNLRALDRIIVGYDCPLAQKEFRLMRWQVDPKTDRLKVPRDIDDGNDHTVDMTRYGMQKVLLRGSARTVSTGGTKGSKFLNQVD